MTDGDDQAGCRSAPLLVSGLESDSMQNLSESL